MTLTESIKIAQKNLDYFNLEVAQFRVEHDMSRELIHLYGAMGNMSALLIHMEKISEKAEELDRGICERFEILKEKDK